MAMGYIGEISNSYPSQTLGPISLPLQISFYITTSAQRVDVPNLSKIDSAVAALRMREKHHFAWVFLLTYLSIDRSIRLSVLRHAYRSHFRAILTLNGSNDVFLQPVVPFGGRDQIAPNLGGQILPKPPFWGVNRRFQAKLSALEVLRRCAI